jgi:hypothetical protein
MTHTKWILATTLVVGGAARSAAAQETIPREIDAPKKALEFGVGVGYSQGTGEIQRLADERVSDVAGAGVEGALDIGWRFNPHWLVGGYGTFAYFRTPDTTPSVGNDITVRGVTTGAQVQYHFAPMKRWDPWIGVGAGYRGIFSSPQDGPVDSRHGIQFARVRLGIDARVSRSVAIGPVVGMDATMFTSVHTAGQSGSSGIDSSELTVTPFFFAGLAGRFDVGGGTERAATSNKMAFSF